MKEIIISRTQHADGSIEQEKMPLGQFKLKGLTLYRGGDPQDPLAALAGIPAEDALKLICEKVGCDYEAVLKTINETTQ